MKKQTHEIQILVIFMTLLVYIYLFGSFCFSTIVEIILSVCLGYMVATMKTAREVQEEPRTWQRRTREEQQAVKNTLRDNPDMTH